MGVVVVLALALAVPATQWSWRGTVKLSRGGTCHCPGGAYWARTLRFEPYPSIERCLAAGGRYPERGQGECDVPMVVGPFGGSATRTPSGALYDRGLFGAWSEPDGDCRNTRHELLAALSTVTVRWSPDGCMVERGRWTDPYTGRVHLDADALDVDHVVPLAWAWARGADGWDRERRRALAHDPANLLPTEARLNRQKGARGPLEWLPPDEGARCAYLLRFVRVARTHGLRIPAHEARGLEALRRAVCG